ncbi:hypothetical protein [Persephonella sp.]
MMIKTPAKAPSNEKELEEFLMRLEVEIKMSRIKKRERIARKFRKYLEMQAIEHEMDISTMEMLIDRSIDSIKYSDIQAVLKKLNDFMPRLVRHLKEKIREWQNEI